MAVKKTRKPPADDGLLEYTVLADQTAHDGVLYNKGDTIKLSEDRAKTLRDHGVCIADAEVEEHA